jgi:hypothetical protein
LLDAQTQVFKHFLPVGSAYNPYRLVILQYHTPNPQPLHPTCSFTLPDLNTNSFPLLPLGNSRGAAARSGCGGW